MCPSCRFSEHLSKAKISYVHICIYIYIYIFLTIYVHEAVCPLVSVLYIVYVVSPLAAVCPLIVHGLLLCQRVKTKKEFSVVLQAFTI